MTRSINNDNGKLPIAFSDSKFYTSGVLGLRWYQPPYFEADAEPNGIIWDWQDDANKPTFSILLADLFPFLKMNQLPLYKMSEQVSIHLTFTPRVSGTGGLKSERVCTTAGPNLSKDVVLVRTDCQMIADYIYYPQDMMNQNGQENFP